MSCRTSSDQAQYCRSRKPLFWLGDQGYTGVDLGRLWQILLFAGLMLWLLLMFRVLKLALTQRSESRPLMILFLMSSIAIPLF